MKCKSGHISRLIELGLERKKRIGEDGLRENQNEKRFCFCFLPQIFLGFPFVS